MTETELQAEIKRLAGQIGQQAMELRNLKLQSLGMGSTFAGVVRELLLAMADPDDGEAVIRAKKHAKDLLKTWDQVQEANIPKPPEEVSNGVNTPS